MKNERINKKRYKIITYFCVFLLVVIAGVGLALSFPNKKVNAGVIVSSSYILAGNSSTRDIYESQNDHITYAMGVGSVALRNLGANGATLGSLYDESFNLLGSLSVNSVRFDFLGVGVVFTPNDSNLTGGTISLKPFEILDGESYEDGDARAIIPLNDLFNDIRDFGTNETYFTNNNISLVARINGIFASASRRFYTKANTITTSNNIFDLPNNALTLLYINDVSGLATNALRDEITINWGYIDSNDNTIYAEHAPTISAQNLLTDDKIIRLGIPINVSGDAMNYYDISQQALLNISSLPQGSATATAHIYGVYVWHNSNDIKWGLAEFNTQVDPLPGSALNMNYITSLTELYDYQNMNTGTMTCRLSVSSNFNFITIKNQTNGPDKDSINAVIQQGGFLPAWSVYNWARGTYSGFIAGDASARADYLEGQPGYEAIYQAGFRDGFANAELGTANWFITSFKAVDAFLSIHIFPNITFGVLLGIPFVISVAWFIIRMFRGGGGD